MYSTNEAAEKLGLSQPHVKLLARKGVIKAKKVGRDWIVLSLDYKRKRRLKKAREQLLDKTVEKYIRLKYI
jgi:excisionase family DNA binding protein